MKKSKRLEFVEQKEPHITAICEVKSQIPKLRIELYYVIPGYSLHVVNLSLNIGRGLIISIHSSIDNCVI